jgi:hypothetical protein
MAPYIDRDVSRRRKRSKSVREDDATLDIQRQVLLRHSIHLRVIDVCHGKDGNLKMLTPGSAPERLAPVYGQASYLSVISATSGGVCLDLNPYAGPYHHTTMFLQEIPNGASILSPSAEASNSSSSAGSPDQDSADDYPEIEGSPCWNSAEEGRLIIMVAPTR